MEEVVEAGEPVTARESLKGMYERPPRQYNDMMKVSMLTIWDVGLFEQPLVAEAASAQRGELEYAVAALCLWLTTPVAKYVCADLPIHRVPLHKWTGAVKNFANDARRLGQIFGRGQAEVEMAFKLRRLVSLAGRSSADADWEKEVRERTQLTTPKRGYGSGKVSSAAYRTIRDKVLRRIAGQVVRSLERTGGSFEEFFEQRWWNTPRGTTSRGGDVKRQLKNADKHLDLQMRPIKPTVMELYTRQQLLSDLRGVPFSVARGSTKPEPGMKCRALLAVDDRTALIAGYASHGIETTTKEGGMVLRQDPADVAEWVAFDLGPNVWRVSNDYSNFNGLNSLRSMQLVDLSLAEWWDKSKEPWAKEKALASRWVAASYLEPFITTPLGEARVKSGLWSGHRNTARDNTFLHLVYLECIKSVMSALFGDGAEHNKVRLCGDDETLGYKHWGAAVLHTVVADELGFTSQVSKGMLSRKHDEFLQLLRQPGRAPSYPIANTILTFCSGNWYKDPVRDLNTTIADVSDHLWDLVLGGVDAAVCQKLGCYVLDYLMQVKKSDGALHPLEWWSYRSSGIPGGHPLWGGVETEGPPQIKVKLPRIKLPHAATQDSVKKEWPVWEKLQKHRLEDVKNERAWSSYRVVAKHWLQEEYDKAALVEWPERKSVAMPDCRPQRHIVPVNRWRAVGNRDRPRSARAVAVKCGFPPELLGSEDMWKAMAWLSPRDRSNMYAGLAERQPTTKGWRWEMPPLLRTD
nr:RNA-dependent RNA polymerase [Umbelopsis ramanniana virus 6b]